MVSVSDRPHIPPTTVLPRRPGILAASLGKQAPIGQPPTMAQVAESDRIAREAEQPYQPQVGHRVRYTVSVEGTVARVSEVVVDLDNGYSYDLRSVEGSGDVTTWERLPDPEPEWAPGDMVLDATGAFFRRRDREASRANVAPWESGGGDWESEDYPKRPLTRLVPTETYAP